MTSKRSNGANGAAEPELPAAAMLAFTPLAAVSNFRLSQSLALEATRFWARRMHAYAEQMETLATCAEPKDLVAAQARFLSRLQEDYASESEALSAIWQTQPDDANLGENA